MAKREERARAERIATLLFALDRSPTDDVREECVARFADAERAEALREALDDLRFYFPDCEPQRVALGDDCTIEVDEETGDLMIQGRGESGDMSGREFFEHVEHGLWKLRQYWKARLTPAEKPEPGGGGACVECGATKNASACPNCGKVFCQRCAEEPYAFCCDDIPSCADEERGGACGECGAPTTLPRGMELHGPCEDGKTYLVPAGTRGETEPNCPAVEPRCPTCNDAVRDGACGDCGGPGVVPTVFGMTCPTCNGTGRGGEDA